MDHLEDAVEHAREAAYNWLYLEVEEERARDFPIRLTRRT